MKNLDHKQANLKEIQLIIYKVFNRNAKNNPITKTTLTLKLIPIQPNCSQTNPPKLPSKLEPM